MTWVGSARDEILLSIRRQLYGKRAAGAATSSAQPLAESTQAALLPASVEARVTRFRGLCELVGGRVHLVADELAAALALAKIVETLDAREIALSDAPLVRRLAAGLGPRRQLFDGWRDRRRLFDADVGLSAAQWGIAETGSLVLDSSREKHRLVSLVPPVHVAVLSAQDILGSLGEAFAVAHSRPGGVAPTLTLVTGPSRTADIELTLVIGVHGPRELHVILMESAR